MRDNSSHRWINQMWKASKDFPPRFPSTRKPLPEIHDPPLEPSPNCTITCDSSEQKSAMCIARNAIIFSRDNLQPRLWISSPRFPKGQKSCFFLPLWTIGKEKIQKYSRISSARDSFACASMEKSLPSTKTSCLIQKKHTRSTSSLTEW